MGNFPSGDVQCTNRETDIHPMPITQALQLPAVSPSRMPPLLQTTWTSGHQSPAVDTNEEYNVTRTTAS